MGLRASRSATITTTASRTCSSRTGARTSSTATTAMAPSPMSRSRPGLLHRRHALGLRLHLYRLRSRRPSRPVCRQLPRFRSRRVPKPGENGNCMLERRAGHLRTARPPTARFACITTTATERSPTSASSRASRKAKGSYAHDCRRGRFRRRRLARYLCRLRFHPQLSASGTITTEPSPKRPGTRRRAQRGRHGAGRHGCRDRRLQSRRPPRSLQNPLRRDTTFST